MANMPKSVTLKDVIEGGYCIGCGACAAAEPELYELNMNEKGRFQAKPHPQAGNEHDTALNVCPFSGRGPNETQIAAEQFPECSQSDGRIGSFLNCYVGYVAEGDFRKRGSSGGMGRWLAAQLMEKNMVDAVVQVMPGQTEVHAADPRQDGESKLGVPLHTYRICRTKEEVLDASRSAYYPVEASNVLREVKEHPGRYLFIGTPCFVKAVRLLARVDEIFRERIAYCIGIVCGHLKSSRYGEMIAWQEGIKPTEIRQLEFRKKYPGSKANQKGMEFVYDDGGIELRKGNIVQRYFGTNYNLGLFKYEACDYCDDVLAETADVVVGDAWLKDRIKDGRGTNILIVREKSIETLVRQAIEESRLALDIVTADTIAESQAGGLRHRRDGLAYRLAKKKTDDVWYPSKRVEAQVGQLPLAEMRKYEMRLVLANECDRIFEQARNRDSFKYFERKITKLMEACESGTYWMSPLELVIYWARSFLMRAYWFARRLASRIKHGR